MRTPHERQEMLMKAWEGGFRHVDRVWLGIRIPAECLDTHRSALDGVRRRASANADRASDLNEFRWSEAPSLRSAKRRSNGGQVYAELPKAVCPSYEKL